MAYDVLIAGGGPVGLFLACELRLAGVSVLLLEKNQNPSTLLKSGWMGARGLNFPSTEAFYRRALLENVKAASFGWLGGARPGMEFKGDANTPPPPDSAPRFAGHFAGMMLDASKVDFSDQKWVIPGPSVGGGMVSLEALEGVLRQRAEALGADIRLGQEVTGFDETADGVSVQAADNEFHARWLVGCDGSRSIVRRLAGFEFEGTDPELTGFMAVASTGRQRLRAKICRRCCSMSQEPRSSSKPCRRPPATLTARVRLRRIAKDACYWREMLRMCIRRSADKA
jgi:2-polyprenyl-6-methoxyphenol hydroxylase-like FAD-dependent oxidoreductase